MTGDVGPDGLTAEMDAAIDEVNRDAERRAQVNGFMALEHSMRVLANERHEEGLAAGEARAEERRSALVLRLAEDGRSDDLLRSAEDPALLEQALRRVRALRRLPMPRPSRGLAREADEGAQLSYNRRDSSPAWLNGRATDL